jgi:uncharacterized protein (TIGR03437 family)
MRSLHAAGWFVVVCLLAAPAVAQQNQITGGSCTAANLNGVYALTLSGRAISAAGAMAGAMQVVGTATFDGTSAVTFNWRWQRESGRRFVVQLHWELCRSEQLLAERLFIRSGKHGDVYTGGLGWRSRFRGYRLGRHLHLFRQRQQRAARRLRHAHTVGRVQFQRPAGRPCPGPIRRAPPTRPECFNSTARGISRPVTRRSIGGAAPAAVTATGTYSVTSACLASATFVDSNGLTNTVNLALTGNYGATADLIIANPQFIRSGSAHAAFLNPAQSIGNVFSYALNSTPPGSVFVLFGTNLATRAASAATVPFPTKLLNTTVTVNGTAAPLYYVSPTQINAIMPWETPGGALASAVVTNGTTTSNAAAVYVPATGTPGIAVYGSNHAVVTNSDGITVNSASAPANVGDEVVAWFTGGGPVNAASTLKTGGPAPSGLSPITGSYYVTVGTAVATVKYIGLTPGSIGLYQVNFIVPQLAKGSYPVQIVIAGQASNAPVMAVGN